ncbi:MAG: hypothetical protein NTU57_00165 [Candidatus Aenigmarchaeota archaeon]|nr:hypothetical protein [Candidatus Aenigmarchaeota archaeon]
MCAMKDNEYTVVTIFLLGVIISIYYIVSVLNAPSVTVILEKTILTGVFIAILITIAIMLFRFMELKKEIDAGVKPGVAKPHPRTSKDVKADMMKIYRDMGALKIVSKDNLIDKNMYNKERKELDNRLVVFKKEYETFVKPEVKPAQKPAAAPVKKKKEQKPS